MDWIASLWSSPSFWEGVEYFAEGIVITGVFFEGAADFELILKGHENEQRRKRVERIAFLALVGGLAVGLMALMRTNQLFTETIAVLYGEARDANKRAETAFQEATAARRHGELLEAEAATLRARTEREINARLALEKQFILEGPREFPLNAARSQFEKRLRIFSGQRFRLSVCWDDLQSRDLGQNEIMGAEQAIRLGLSDAGWKFAGNEQFPLPFMVNNCQSNFIVVRAPQLASERTCSAVEALQRLINVVVSDSVPPLCHRDPSVGSDPEPDVIDIHVGKHSVHPAIKTKRATK